MPVQLLTEPHLVSDADPVYWSHENYFMPEITLSDIGLEKEDTAGLKSWLYAEGEAAVLSSDPSSPMRDEFPEGILLKCSKVKVTAQGCPGRGAKRFLAALQPCQVTSPVFKHVSYSKINFSKSKLPKAKRKSPRRAHSFFPRVPHFLLCTKRT